MLTDGAERPKSKVYTRTQNGFIEALIATGTHTGVYRDYKIYKCPYDERLWNQIIR